MAVLWRFFIQSPLAVAVYFCMTILAHPMPSPSILNAIFMHGIILPKRAFLLEITLEECRKLPIAHSWNLLQQHVDITISTTEYDPDCKYNNVKGTCNLDDTYRGKCEFTANTIMSIARLSPLNYAMTAAQCAAKSDSTGIVVTMDGQYKGLCMDPAALAKNKIFKNITGTCVNNDQVLTKS